MRNVKGIFLTRYVFVFALAVVFVLVVAFFVGLAVGQSDWWQHKARCAGPAQKELLLVYIQLNPGDSADDMMCAWNELSPKYLRLKRENVYAIVSTPLNVFGRNWILYIRINEEEITEVCIRTLDSPKMHPDDAPPDKIADACETASSQAVISIR